MHADGAANVHFAGAGEQVVAHHAHHRAGHHAEVFFQRRPALDGADGAIGLLHPVLDDHAQLGHLDQCGERDVVGRDIGLDRRELGLHRIVVVLEPLDAAQDFGKIERLDRDAAALQQLLAVANRVEGRGTRADRAHAKVGKAAHHAADRGEPRQVLAEVIGVGLHRVRRGQRVGNAVLHHVVAGRHLSAEAVAAVGDLHVRGPVGSRLHQHRHLQGGEAQGIDNPPLFAEIGKCNNDAVNFVAVLAEQIAAKPRFRRRFDGAELGFFRGQGDGADAVRSPAL